MSKDEINELLLREGIHTMSEEDYQKLESVLRPKEYRFNTEIKVQAEKGDENV